MAVVREDGRLLDSIGRLQNLQSRVAEMRARGAQRAARAVADPEIRRAVGELRAEIAELRDLQDAREQRLLQAHARTGESSVHERRRRPAPRADVRVGSGSTGSTEYHSGWGSSSLRREGGGGGSSSGGSSGGRGGGSRRPYPRHELYAQESYAADLRIMSETFSGRSRAPRTANVPSHSPSPLRSYLRDVLSRDEIVGPMAAATRGTWTIGAGGGRPGSHEFRAIATAVRNLPEAGPSPCEGAQELVCAVCLCEYERAGEQGGWCELPMCGHRFHRSCIARWFETRQGRRQRTTCPLCLAPFREGSPVRAADLNDPQPPLP